MKSKLLCSAIAVFVIVCSSAFAAAAPYVKPNTTTGTNNNTNNNKNNTAAKDKEPPKYDPVVIHFQSAQRQRLGGYDVMVISGTEALGGKPRQFGVANRDPQDKSKVVKYDPKAEVADVVKGMKQGEYLKVEIKADKMGSILWADKVSIYTPADHEEEPGVYLWDGGYKDTAEGQDVYKVELVKLGKRFVCYAAMVPSGEKGKGNVPDPAVIASAEAIEKAKPAAAKKKEAPPEKELVEANLSPAGQNYFVTSLDIYQAPQQANFTKVVDADVESQKGQAVELDASGKTVTAMIPGKMMGKKWVTDATLLAEAKKLKAGTAVIFKTREIDGKTYLRQLTVAPKETAKPAAKTPDANMNKGKTGADQLLPDKKK